MNEKMKWKKERERKNKIELYKQQKKIIRIT